MAVAEQSAATDYVKAVLAAYVSLPGTPERPSRRDRQLARQLHRRGVPLETIRGAFLLAAARRTFRRPEAEPLGPIRTLFYFLHLIDEVTDEPLDRGYLDYIVKKLRPFMKSGGVQLDSG
jgi:hypothetical protein